MKTVDLHFQGEATDYKVTIQQGAVEALGSILQGLASERVVVLADEHVLSLYGPSITTSLEAARLQVLTSSFAASESSKSLQTVQSFYDFLLSNRIERNTPIIALGGGIAGDVVGFVAASYLRGLPFIQVPTTLLAMVDASVGGKVGVNLPQGKNLVGAFHQPRAVVIDPLVLNTLSEREFRAGLSECIKHAVIADSALFDWTENHLSQILARDPTTLEELIARNVGIKAKIVMADEKEKGERAFLNLGHTFAHAIESTTQYTTYLHGEAVAIGLVAAADLAVRACRNDSDRPALEATKHRIETLVAAAGLPVRMPIAGIQGDTSQCVVTVDPGSADTDSVHADSVHADSVHAEPVHAVEADAVFKHASTGGSASVPTIDLLLTAMQLDKKVERGNIRFVLPKGIGGAEMRKDIPQRVVVETLGAIRELANK